VRSLPPPAAQVEARRRVPQVGRNHRRRREASAGSQHSSGATTWPTTVPVARCFSNACRVEPLNVPNAVGPPAAGVLYSAVATGRRGCVAARACVAGIVSSLCVLGPDGVACCLRSSISGES
jgi:hypothetical protein